MVSIPASVSRSAVRGPTPNSARTGWGAADLAAKLLDLELAGRIERLPGQRFQRIARA